MVHRLLALAPLTDVFSSDRIAHWPHIEHVDATAAAQLGFLNPLASDGRA